MTYIRKGLVVLLGLVCGLCRADTIRQKNGSTAQVIILEASENLVTYTEGIGQITLPRSLIDQAAHASEEENRTLRARWAEQYFYDDQYVPESLKSLAVAYRKLCTARAEMQQAVRRRHAREAEDSYTAGQTSAKLAKIAKEQTALNAQCDQLNEPLQKDSTRLSKMTDEMSLLAKDYNTKSLDSSERIEIWDRYYALKKLRDPLLEQTQQKEAEYRGLYSRLTELHSQYYELTRKLKFAGREMSDHFELVKYQNVWTDFQSELQRCKTLEPQTQYDAALARFSAGAQSVDSNIRRDWVAVSRHGGVFQTTVVVNGGEIAVLIVDTGASQTSISRKFAERLNLGPLDNIPAQPFRLADGRTGSAPVVQLASVQVGSVVRTNVMAMVMDDAPGTDVDGLLGMNFLENFVVRMDSDKNDLELISYQE